MAASCVWLRRPDDIVLFDPWPISRGDCHNACIRLQAAKTLSKSRRMALDSAAMSAILAQLRDHPVKHFAAGEPVLVQGESSGILYILIDGAVEVVKEDVIVATASEPGAVFGDLSALLGGPHTAGVRATRPSNFYIVSNPRAFLEQNPQVCLHLCELLARRLDAVNKYLINVKHQFAGHDHIGMVDSVLDTLMHRHPRQRVAPKPSTIRGPEVAE